MIKKLKSSLLLIIVSLAAVFIALMALEIRDDYINTQLRAKLREQTKPHYMWSFYSSDGLSLGKSVGTLKLEMHPIVIYKNVPKQKEKKFSTNSLGFRGTEIDKKATGKKLIVIIGASSAFGTGVKIRPQRGRLWYKPRGHDLLGQHNFEIS